MCVAEFLKAKHAVVVGLLEIGFTDGKVADGIGRGSEMDEEFLVLSRHVSAHASHE